MNFDFNDSTPLYQQIADQLEEMIFSGGFDEGGNKYHYEFWLDGNNTAEKLSNFS